MNLPRRALVRPLTSCLAAGAVAAAVLVPVAASAAPAPARSGTVATTAAAQLGTRSVTPPRAVTKKQLVGIFRAAARATDAGLRRGASLRTVQETKGTRTAGSGRARGGLLVTRDATGSATILDLRTGSAYLSIDGVAARLEVSPAELAAALTTLGNPSATWAELAGGPASGGGFGQSLVNAAKDAKTWTWKRSKGLTTWRLTSTTRVFGSTIRSTQVFVLDSHQRLVRQSETDVSSLVRLTVRSSLTFRYRSVAPVTRPTPAHTVDFAALLRLLAGSPDAG